MIINQNGRYFIAFHESTNLEDIVAYQNHLIELLKVASTAEIFDDAEDMVFNICNLLHELNFNQTQAIYFDRGSAMAAFDMERLKEVESQPLHNR